MHLRSSALLLALLTLLVCAPHGAAQQQDARATLLPDRQYAILVKKSLAGNDGFRDVVPTTSTQSITIETGARADGRFPVTLITHLPQRVDAKPSAAGADAAIEWKITFDVAADGSLGNLAAVSGEGGVPPSLVRSIVMKQLAGILFLTTHPIEAKNVPVVSVTAVKPRAGSALLDLAYTATRPAAETTSASEPMSEQINGNAVYDPAAHLFIERTQHESSTIYVTEDSYGESKTVKMNVTTIWQATVRGK